MKKNLFFSVFALILIVAVVANGSYTGASFRDTESAAGNTLSAWESSLWPQNTYDEFSAGTPGNVDISFSGNVSLSGTSGTVSDSFIDQNLIASLSNLTVVGGQVKLAFVSGGSGTETLRPNGPGSLTELTASPLNSNYLRVSESVSDGDSSYVFNTKNPVKNDTYAIADHSIGSGVVNGVTVHIRAMRTSNKKTGYAKTIIRTHNTNYLGGTINLTTAYSEYTTAYPTNPSTKAAWTWAEIDALESGVQLYTQDNSGNQESRCTQVWMTVDYSPVYNSSGTLVSKNILAGQSNGGLNHFHYTTSSIPSGANLKAQFSQDGTQWYNSSHISNGWDDLSSGSNNLDITALGWSGPNFYYRIQFLSSGISTPLLDDVSITYNNYYSSGTLDSHVLDTGISGTQIDALFWNKDIPSGTDISLAVRASDDEFQLASQEWISVGNVSPVLTGLPAGQYMQWQAVLTTSDGTITPVLSEVKLYYSLN